MAQEQEQRKENRPPREGRGAQGAGSGPRGDRPGGDPPGGERGDRGDRGERRGFDRGRPEGPPEIELEKLIGDSRYLANQAHALVSRIREMDKGTKTQPRRLASSVRRACPPAD